MGLVDAMGLLDWLLGKKDSLEIAQDRIWLTKRAKFAGVQAEIAAALAEPQGPDAIFLVGHFDDCLADLQSLADRAGFDRNRVLVVRSEALEGRATESGLSGSNRVLIVVGERHPLTSHDDGLRAFARNLACPCRFSQHASLEDPVLKLFAGQWVQDVLRRLGMKEDEVIESRMVARRIRKAQQKIERQAIGNSQAGSAEEWLEKNCPNVG